jgi:hypothetical protein
MAASPTNRAIRPLRPPFWTLAKQHRRAVGRLVAPEQTIIPLIYLHESVSA